MMTGFPFLPLTLVCALSGYVFAIHSKYDLKRPGDPFHGKGAYGYQYVDGKHNYIVGPESPISFHEGPNHRMFQVVIPADVSYLRVWPYTRKFKNSSSVTKVTLHGLSSQPMYTHIDEAAGSDDTYFSIKVYRQDCETGGKEKANVLQVAQGDYATHNDKRSFMRVERRRPASGSDYIPLTDFKQTPVVLIQLMNIEEDHKWVSVRLHFGYENFWRQYFTATGWPGGNNLVATFGIISITDPGGNADFFGPYSYVQASRGLQTSVSAVTNHTLDFNGEAFEGEPMIFVQPELVHEEPRVHSANRDEFALEMKQGCGKDSSQIIGFNKLAISFVNSPDMGSVAVREGLEDYEWGDYYVNLGCPYVGSVGKCAGLYKAVEGTAFKVWQHVSKPDYQIVLDGVLKCKKGDEVVETNMAACIFSDTYCPKLTVLKRTSNTDYTMIGSKIWGYGGGSQLKYTGRTSSQRMIFNNKFEESNEVVCHNDVLPRGPVYGMNRLDSDRVYVVGAKDMIEGFYFRLFSIDVPADGSTVTVYPMVIDWGYLATATKLMVQNSASGRPFVPMITEGMSSTFKMKLSRPDCDWKTTFKGTVRVNVLQVRLGFYYDVWKYTEYIGAGTNTAGGSVASYKYSFGDSSVLKTFNTTPILFSQIYKIDKAEDGLYQAPISDVTSSGFHLRIQGFNHQPVPATGFTFAWIGIGLTTQLNLFNSAVASRLISSESTDTLKKAEFSTYTSKPYVFVQSQDVENNAVTHDIVRDVSLDNAKIGVELDSCRTAPAQTGKLTGIVIGRVAEKRHRRIRYFNEQDVRCPFEFVFVDEVSTRCKLLDNYCDRLLISGRTRTVGIHTKDTYAKFRYDRFHDMKPNGGDNWGEFRNIGGPENIVKLEVGEAFNSNFVTNFFAVGSHGNNRWLPISPRTVLCVNHVDMERAGRIEHDGKTIWNAYHDVVEGPGTPDERDVSNRRLPYWNAAGSVHVKYFQMTVQDGDQNGNGIFAFYGGYATGNMHAYGSTYSPSTMGVVFSKEQFVYGDYDQYGEYGIFVKPMDKCGVLKKQDVKINVMVVAQGTNTSDDGRVVIKSERVDVHPGARANQYVTKTDNIKENALLFAGIQETGLSGFVQTSVGYKDKVASIFMICEDGAKRPEHVTLLSINISGDAKAGMIYASFGSFKMLTYDKFPSVGPSGSEIAFGSGFGMDEPFVLLATRAVDGPAEDCVSVQKIDASNMTLKANTKCEGSKEDAHVNAVIIGEYPR